MDLVLKKKESNVSKAKKAVIAGIGTAGSISVIPNLVSGASSRGHSFIGNNMRTVNKALLGSAIIGSALSLKKSSRKKK